MTSPLSVDASLVSIFEAIHKAVSSKGYYSHSILEEKDVAVFVLSIEDKSTAGILAAYHHVYQLLKDAFPAECDYVCQCCELGQEKKEPYFTVNDGGWSSGWKPGEAIKVDLLKVPPGGKVYVAGKPQDDPSSHDLPEPMNMPVEDND